MNDVNKNEVNCVRLHPVFLNILADCGVMGSNVKLGKTGIHEIGTFSCLLNANQAYLNTNSIRIVHKNYIQMIIFFCHRVRYIFRSSINLLFSQWKYSRQTRTK